MVKNGKALEVMGLLDQVYLTNAMHFSNKMVFGLTSSLLSIFDIYLVLVIPYGLQSSQII